MPVDLPLEYLVGIMASVKGILDGVSLGLFLGCFARSPCPVRLHHVIVKLKGSFCVELQRVGNYPHPKEHLIFPPNVGDRD